MNRKRNRGSIRKGTQPKPKTQTQSYLTQPSFQPKPKPARPTLTPSGPATARHPGPTTSPRPLGLQPARADHSRSATCRRHATPAHPNPTGATQRLCLNAVKLPGASTLGLDPCSAGIAPDLNSVENGPPSQFLATGASPARLTSPLASQRTRMTTRGTKATGAARLRLRHELRSSPPPDLDVDPAPLQLRPDSSLGEHHPVVLCLLR